MLEHGFAFGSCRMRMMECPYCVTVLSSMTQVLYWLDIMDGKRPKPDTPQLRQLVSYEQADIEPYAYDLSAVRSIIVEVCTAKTLWYGEHPVSLLGNHRKESLGVPTTLVVDTPDDLYRQMEALRARLAGKFLVFVCQQSYQSDNFSLYYATAQTRQAIRDLIFRAAKDLPDCAAYDPTPRVAELGPDNCLLDLHHWSPVGGKVFASDVRDLIPAEFR